MNGDRFSLKFLWELSMRKPFKARLEHWPEGAWFMCLGVAPVGMRQAFGHMHDGVGVGFESEQPIWGKHESE